MEYHKIINRIVCVTLLIIAGGLSSSPVRAYEAGTFSIKPLNMSFSDYNLGTRPKDSNFTIVTFASPLIFGAPPYTTTKISKLNGWRAARNFGFSESDRNGNGYAFEAGYVVIKDWEVFGRAGYCQEKPKGQFMLGSEHSFRMKQRDNWGLSLGLRRYLETSNSFKPYAAFALGFVSQGATNIDVFAHPVFNGNDIRQDVFQQRMNLLKRQALFSFEISLGVDYMFNNNWVISGSVAARYNQRGGSTTVMVPGHLLSGFPVPSRPMSYADNKQHWYVPVTLSLKYVF